MTSSETNPAATTAAVDPAAASSGLAAANPLLPGLAEPDPKITAIFEEIHLRHKTLPPPPKLSEIYPRQSIDGLVKQFLVESGLVSADQIRENVPYFPLPAHIVTPTHVINCYWRIGPLGKPDPRWVLEADSFLLKRRRNKELPLARWAVFTDGRDWVVRRPGQSGVEPVPEDILFVENPEDWPLAYRWLLDQINTPEDEIPPHQVYLEMDELNERAEREKERRYKEAVRRIQARD